MYQIPPDPGNLDIITREIRKAEQILQIPRFPYFEVITLPGGIRVMMDQGGYCWLELPETKHHLFYFPYNRRWIRLLVQQQLRIRP